MDKALRNTLRNAVTQCRKLLEDAIAETLEGQYGVFRTGKIEDTARMVHLSPDETALRERILVHLHHVRAGGFKDRDALDQLIREVAYTHLNRLAAYKMMEKRDLIRETVSRGMRSQGFQFYLADHPADEQVYNAGKQDSAYRHFLTWQGAQFSSEIGVLFSPYDLANGLFPPQRVIDEVLDRINSNELKDIWAEDEAIGWIYQYFTPKELRDKARAESQAPRNSYELSFRNQFFTPRYVVEFLTDNTLGRIWYEMLKGDTALTERCRYLVRRPTEIFLNEREDPPRPEGEGDTGGEGLSQEELLRQPVYIPHRPLKDPRRLRILDPACGSGHFLLYCFDLLAVIYEEAWERDLRDPAMDGLRVDYPTLDGLRLNIPRLILAHNLHGIDIDARATQIAALALWLRSQRYYQEALIPSPSPSGRGGKVPRPLITRGNIVCAEPMPGDALLLEEFVATLNPPLIGGLVRAVFHKMTLAGEAGSLLKIEEELTDAIAAAKKQFTGGGTAETLAMFPDLFPVQPKQLGLFDLSGIDDVTFFETVEKTVLEALHTYARSAANGKGLQRQLFADDAARGFAFIDLCRQRYDVVLMNPPFGDSSADGELYIRYAYPNWTHNLICAFIQMTQDRLDDRGQCGAVIDRTVLIKNSYEKFRQTYLLDTLPIQGVVDLGWNVLDANVEVSILVTATSVTSQVYGDNVVTSMEKDSALFQGIRDMIWLPLEGFKEFPFSSINFEMPQYLKAASSMYQKLGGSFGAFYNGHTIKSDVFKRLYWEINLKSGAKHWRRMWNGSEYSPFYVAMQEVVIWDNYVGGVMNHSSTILRSPKQHFEAGLCFGKRGDYLDLQILPKEFVLTNEGFGGKFSQSKSVWYLLGYFNSLPVQQALNFYCGQHKGVGYVNALPVPQYGDILSEQIAEVTKLAFDYARNTWRTLETDPNFVAIWLQKPFSKIEHFLDEYVNQNSLLSKCSAENDDLVVRLLKLDVEELDTLLNNSTNRPKARIFPWIDDNKQQNEEYFAQVVISYIFGIKLGRWDIRYATGEQLIPDVPDPFAPLPACPPGMLQGADGLPLTQSPDGYPLDIQWDGVLVDDEGHPADVVGRVRQVIELLWGERAAAIEREACEILGVKTLRDYFRKSGKGGFWDDHVKRYSKSRRQAPIYWLLQSSKKNYGMWLYYHRLDKDLLYKALVNYVEPKLRLEESRLNDLRGQLSAVGNTGSTAKRLAGEVDKQEALLAELDDFRDKLKRAADLNLEPDLNDGVVLNIAPLWELVPWKVAKAYWDELREGKYEWSTVSQQLRARGVI